MHRLKRNSHNKALKLVGTGVIGGFAGQGASVSLSVDGNTAIVGGPLDGVDSTEGAVWVFTRSGGVWNQQGPKLVGTGVVGPFGATKGISVSLSNDGNTFIEGGYGDNSDAGAAWVFVRSEGVWSQQGPKLVGTGATTGFVSVEQGFSVALSGDGNTAIVGARTDNCVLSFGYAGAAWVFTRASGVWSQQGPKLVAADAIGGAGLGFSAALSSDGNTTVIGGAFDDNGVGAAWIFTRSGGVWSEQAKLVGTGAVGPYGAEQGVSVSLSGDGNTAIVGGPPLRSSGAEERFNRIGTRSKAAPTQLCG